MVRPGQRPPPLPKTPAMLSMSSTTLPKVALSRPPMACPNRTARSSVTSPRISAMGMRARKFCSGGMGWKEIKTGPRLSPRRPPPGPAPWWGQGPGSSVGGGKEARGISSLGQRARKLGSGGRQTEGNVDECEGAHTRKACAGGHQGSSGTKDCSWGAAAGEELRWRPDTHR